MARILLIDDEELVRNFLRTVIENRGYDVTTAANGNEGLRLLGEGNYDVVITDLFMDDKDGISTIMDIKKQDSDIPIIAMSGGGWSSGVDYLKVAQQMGVAYTFSKPIPNKEFLAAIDSLVAG